MAGYNLPDGCPEYLDRPPCWDDENPPELTEAELDAEYAERIDASADAAPPNVFYECAEHIVTAPLALSPAPKRYDIAARLGRTYSTNAPRPKPRSL